MFIRSEHINKLYKWSHHSHLLLVCHQRTIDHFSCHLGYQQNHDAWFMLESFHNQIPFTKHKYWMQMILLNVSKPSCYDSWLANHSVASTYVRRIFSYPIILSLYHKTYLQKWEATSHHILWTEFLGDLPPLLLSKQIWCSNLIAKQKIREWFW